MKLQRIVVKNFCGLASADIQIQTPVTLIVGANATGKSSIRDAVEFAFTGSARGLTKKKDAPALARHGAKDCKVELTIDGKTLSRTPSNCSTTEQEIRRRIGSPELIQAALNALRFLDLPPAGRRDLVRTLTADSEAVRAAVLEAATKAGIADQAAQEIAAGAVLDLDKAERIAVENRRTAKRAAEELAATEAPSSIEINGKPYIFATASTAAIAGHLAELKAERDACQRTIGENKLDGSREGIEAQIESKAAEHEKIKAYARILDEDRTRLEEILTEKATADKAVADVNKALDECKAARSRASFGGERCPQCGQIFPVETRKRFMAEIQQRELKLFAESGDLTKLLGKLAKTEADIRSAIRDHEVDAKRADQLLREITEMRDDLDTWEKREQAGQEAEAKAVELEGRIVNGEAIARAKAAWDGWQQASARREALVSEAAAWDAVAQALGEKGPIRALAAKGFDLAAVQSGADAMLEERRVEVDADWTVRLGGIPVELLSRSERYRLGTAFAATLAAASGLGLLVLDEADVLVGECRPALLAWLGKIRARFGAILVMASSASEVAAPAEWDWLTVVRI